MNTFSPNPPLNQVKQKVGRWMMRGAWIVEVAAVFVGLAIAAAIGWSTAEQIQTANNGVIPRAKWVDIVIAALPLTIIAVVELCRIPLAVASYHVENNKWRALFLTMLLLLITLNFETLSQGFLRQYQNLTYSVEKLYDELQVVNESLNSANTRYAELVSLNPEDLRNKHLDRLGKIQAIYSKEISEIVADHADPALDAKISQIDIEVARLEKAKQDAINREIANQQAQRTDRDRDQKARQNSLTNQLNQEKQDLRDLNAREQRDLMKGNIFTRAGIRDRHAQQRVPIENRIAYLSNELVQINSTPSPVSQDKVAALERWYSKKIDDRYRNRAEIISASVSDSAKDKITFARTQARDRYGKARAVEEGNYQRELELLKDRNSALTRLTKKRIVLTESKTELREQVTLEARNSSIHSLARLISGEKSSADIPPAMIRNVAIVWFSSIALIVAVTGTVLAFASQVLLYGRLEHKKGPSKLVKSIRRLLVRIGRRKKHYRIREIVRVEKEVEQVEKIVTKEVEKPVEVNVYHTKYRYLPVPGWGVSSDVSENNDEAKFKPEPKLNLSGDSE
jgi:hypothetical protein